MNTFTFEYQTLSGWLKRQGHGFYSFVITDETGLWRNAFQVERDPEGGWKATESNMHRLGVFNDPMTVHRTLLEEVCNAALTRFVEERVNAPREATRP